MIMMMTMQVSSLCWIIALLASVPHLVFTQINYIDYPYQSGNFICESAFCAMLDENINPPVSESLINSRLHLSVFKYHMYC